MADPVEGIADQQAPPPEEAEAEVPAEAMAAELPRKAMEAPPPAPATPPPAPRNTPEVTPDKLPKPKARGRPKGSTNKNTYQALAERLDQMDARLAERDERRQRAPSPPRRSAPSSAEEAAAHFISQIGIQAEERRRQRMEVYRSFLPQ